MFALARLGLISFVALAAFVESSAAEDWTSSEFLRDLHVDEVIGDVGAERVIARGTIGSSSEHGRLDVEVECNGDKGTAVVRDPALSTQDLWIVDRKLCDALVTR